MNTTSKLQKIKVVNVGAGLATFAFKKRELRTMDHLEAYQSKEACAVVKATMWAKEYKKTYKQICIKKKGNVMALVGHLSHLAAIVRARGIAVITRSKK